MRRRQLVGWLEKYKYSWEKQDPKAFSELFTPDARYRETPFLEFVQGPEFSAFWEDLATKQADNHFHYDVLFSKNDKAAVHWTASTTWLASNERRVGDGVFLLTFSADFRCRELLEWQHWQAEGAAPLKQWGVS